MKIFIERLRALRKQKGLTQQQTAKALGLSERCYRNYEIDKHVPSLENIIIIADFFDVSIDYLVGRDKTAR
ncbi:MAG: helix-turn-helix domain-containing protein [Oscillospiraceae bacterium]|nr:helix-turn-helix domain-containing protein [Oscillospiraceae bacterium]